MFKIHNSLMFFTVSPQKQLPKIILQVKEIESDDTKQCQQNTDFIRNLLNDITNNALSNSEKFSDVTKITEPHTDKTK